MGNQSSTSRKKSLDTDLSCTCACSVASVMSNSLQTCGACQALLFLGLPRQEHWSGLPCPPPGDLPNPGLKPVSPASSTLQVYSSPLSHQGSPRHRLKVKVKSESCSVMSKSLQPHGLYSPWNSPGQNTGVGSLSLLQGIFPTQGLNPGLLQVQVDSLPAEPQGKPKHTGVGSLSLLLRIFLTQELNSGLLHCRRILYQLSYQESPRHRPETLTKINSIWITDLSVKCHRRKQRRNHR